MLRTELQLSLHRLANHVECELAEIFRQLLAESRSSQAQSLAYNGCDFINSLRQVHDCDEGGEE
jgi:hypothetical protein